VTACELLRQVKKGVNADGDPLIDAAAWTKPQPARGAPLSRAERLSLGSARGAVTRAGAPPGGAARPVGGL